MVTKMASHRMKENIHKTHTLKRTSIQNKELSLTTQTKKTNKEKNPIFYNGQKT